MSDNKSQDAIMKDLTGNVRFMKKLKILTDYFIIHSKLMTMNELEQYKTTISKDDLLKLVKEDNIICTDNEDFSDVGDTVEVYLGSACNTDSANEKRFRQIITFVSTKNLADYPEKDNIVGEVVLSKYIAMSVNYFDSKYEEICDILNEMQEKHGDIINNVNNKEAK